MEIRWSHPVLTLKNLTLITEEVYNLELNQFNEEEGDPGFSWELTEFKSSYLLTQLLFEQPFLVSPGDTFDKVVVYMKRDIFMIKDVWGYHKLEE